MWNDTPKVCFINFLAKESYLLCVSPKLGRSIFAPVTGGL